MVVIAINIPLNEGNQSGFNLLKNSTLHCRFGFLNCVTPPMAEIRRSFTFLFMGKSFEVIILTINAYFLCESVKTTTFGLCATRWYDHYRQRKNVLWDILMVVGYSIQQTIECVYSRIIRENLYFTLQFCSASYKHIHTCSVKCFYYDLNAAGECCE